MPREREASASVSLSFAMAVRKPLCWIDTPLSMCTYLLSYLKSMAAGSLLALTQCTNIDLQLDSNFMLSHKSDYIP